MNIDVSLSLQDLEDITELMGRCIEDDDPGDGTESRHMELYFRLQYSLTNARNLMRRINKERQ